MSFACTPKHLLVSLLTQHMACMSHSCWLAECFARCSSLIRDVLGPTPATSVNASCCQPNTLFRLQDCNLHNALQSTKPVSMRWKQCGCSTPQFAPMVHHKIVASCSLTVQHVTEQSAIWCRAKGSAELLAAAPRTPSSSQLTSRTFSAFCALFSKEPCKPKWTSSSRCACWSCA